MKVLITLDIPEPAIYAGVVTDALDSIAAYWDKGARGGDLMCDRGRVSWDSSVEDETPAEYLGTTADGGEEFRVSWADEETGS